MFGALVEGPIHVLLIREEQGMIQQVAIVVRLAEAARDAEAAWKGELQRCLNRGIESSQDFSCRDAYRNYEARRSALRETLQYLVPESPRKYVGENQGEANVRFLCEVMDAILAEPDHMKWKWTGEFDGQWLHGIRPSARKKGGK